MNCDFSRNFLVHLRRLFDHLDITEEILEGVIIATNPSHQFHNIILHYSHWGNVILEDVMKVTLHYSIELYVANTSLERREATILDFLDVMLATLSVVGLEWQVECCLGLLFYGCLL